MKRILVGLTVLLAMGVAGMASDYPVPMGLHAAYVGGGDMKKDAPGYGLQVTCFDEADVTVELAWTAFQDKRESSSARTEADINVVAVSARYDLPFPTESKFYVGVGGGYNFFHVSLKPRTADMDGMRLSIDDEISWLACGGVRVPLSITQWLFAEYRYTDMEINGTLKSGGATVDRFKESNDYHMIRAGLDFVF